MIGVMTNRTYHSDYAYAYAMMKMGYMSKNFYEMRYTVSHARADGSNTATDLTPNVSFYLDISPEESFETIKERGNAAEIAACNLDFLKHLHEGYLEIWAKDMNMKGCSVFDLPKVNVIKSNDVPVLVGTTLNPIRRFVNKIVTFRIRIWMI